MKVIIVDDEPLARDRLKQLLRKESEVDVVGEFGNGLEVLERFEDLRPDLMFLDIQMPEMDGFELLDQWPSDQLPLIVFTTAYDQYALRAFETHAIDYLLKPFKPKRLTESLQRARDQLANRSSQDITRHLQTLLQQSGVVKENQKEKYLQRLIVKTEDKVKLIRTMDVECIESAGNYVVAKVGKENHILRESLTSLESSLPPSQFMRISRSAIVNLNFVKELSVLFKGEHALVLHDGKELTMTRGMREMEKILKFS